MRRDAEDDEAAGDNLHKGEKLTHPTLRFLLRFC
jgi:hypothetical protein